MAFAPMLYGAVLAVAASYLLLVRKRLDLTSYLFAFFFLYHGPAFFQYQASMRYPREYEIIAGALALAVVAFAVGRVSVSAMLKRLPSRQDWFREPLHETPIENLVLVTGLTIISLVAVMNLLFFGAGARIIQGLSLGELDLVAGEYSRLRRESMTTESAGVWAVAFTYLCRCGPGPFFALFLIARARCNPTPMRVAVAAAFGSLIFLSRASSLAKSDAVYFIGQVALLWSLASPRSCRFDWRLVATGGVVLGGLLFAYTRFAAAASVWQAMELIYYRVTEIPNLCLNMHFEVYPDVIDHTYGMNIRLLHSLFSWGEVYVPAHALLDESGGNANTIFIADAWVDFGWTGVAVAAAIAGAVIGWVDRIVRERRDTMNVALFTSLLFPVQSLISTSLVTCLFGFGLLTLPLMCLTILRRPEPAARSTDIAAIRGNKLSKANYATA
jgi:oligosaccharide repeat unit polymerase